MMDDDVELPAIGLPRALDQLRTNTFTGRDPDNLVTAVVDGAGMVERITLAATVNGRRPQAVATAVLAAILDAQSKGIEAVMELTTDRDFTTAPPPALVNGIVGGPVDGTASSEHERGASA